MQEHIAIGLPLAVHLHPTGAVFRGSCYADWGLDFHPMNRVLGDSRQAPLFCQMAGPECRLLYIRAPGPARLQIECPGMRCIRFPAGREVLRHRGELAMRGHFAALLVPEWATLAPNNGFLLRQWLRSQAFVKNGDDYCRLAEGLESDLLHGTHYFPLLGDTLALRVADYLWRSSGPLPGIDDLCRRFNVCERTLYYRMGTWLGCTPGRLRRNIRLARARYALMLDTAGRRSIAWHASNAGYSHLSRFAQQYRSLFGELPKETRQRVLQQAGSKGVLAKS